MPDSELFDDAESLGESHRVNRRKPPITDSSSRNAVSFSSAQNEALSNGISFFARRRRKLLNNPSQSYPTQPQHDKDADD
jgi:hypothetical protein